MTRDVTSQCAECGASIYQQHLDTGIAGYSGEKLLCSHCLAEVDTYDDTDDDSPIVLEGHEDAGDSVSDMSSSQIHGVSAATLGKAGEWDESRFRRPLQPEISAATRCRTFHCKLTDGAVDYLNNSINEWLDSHDEVTVKFATSTIGQFEGKHTEPNLIITMFYTGCPPPRSGPRSRAAGPRARRWRRRRARSRGARSRCPR